MKLVDAKKYKKQIKLLYQSAFPRNERAPLFFMFHKTKHESNLFHAVIDDGEFVGLVYIIKSEKLVYVFYLAIVEKERGRGYGSTILHMIKNLYPNSVITLAIEDTSEKSADNYAQRIKRLGFYEKNGFKQLHIKFNEVGVIYELLGTSDSVTQADFLALMKKYLGILLFKFVYKSTEFGE